MLWEKKVGLSNVINMCIPEVLELLFSFVFSSIFYTIFNSLYNAKRSNVAQLRIKLIWTVLFYTLNVFTSLHILWSIGCNMQTMESQGGQNQCEACERLDTALCRDPTRIWNISCLSLCQWTICPLTSERKTIPPSGLFSQRTFVYSSRS